MLELGGGHVAVLRAARGSGRDADKELGVLALVARGDDVLPLVVVEVVLAVEGIVADDQIAADIVVELDEEGVELGLLDHLLHGKVRVRGRALGRTGDDDALVEGAELVGHGDPGLVVKVLAANLRKLEVKVETVDLAVLGRALVKGTRALPGSIVGTKGTPEEVGKIAAVLLGADAVVGGLFVPDTTDGKEHLDALATTVLKIVNDGAAVVEQVGGLAVLLEGSAPTVSSKADARIT